jgi:hypothetical protein
MSISLKFLKERIDSLISELPAEPVIQDYEYWLDNPEAAFGKRFFYTNLFGSNLWVDIIEWATEHRSVRYKWSQSTEIRVANWIDLINFLEREKGFLPENLNQLQDIM